MAGVTVVIPGVVVAPVMGGAEGGEVADVGLATLDPGDGVVDIALTERR